MSNRTSHEHSPKELGTVANCPADNPARISEDRAPIPAQACITFANIFLAPGRKSPFPA